MAASSSSSAEAGVQKACNIIALCACHIDNESTQFRFERMLESVLAQTNLSFTMYLSCSVEKSSFMTALKSLQSSFEKKAPFLHMNIRDQPLTQFQHYKKLYDALLLGKLDHSNVWLLFSDADDLWDPQRVEYYQQNLPELSPSQSVHLSHWYGQILDPCLVDSVEKEAVAFSGFEELCCGYFKKSNKCSLQFQVRASDRHDSSPNDDSTPFEYFQCSVRFQVFEDFFQRATDDMLACHWCDLAFTSYIDKVVNKLNRKEVPSWPEHADGVGRYLYLKVGNPSQQRNVDHGRDYAEAVRVLGIRWQMVHFPDSPPPMTDEQIFKGLFGHCPEAVHRVRIWWQGRHYPDCPPPMTNQQIYKHIFGT